jgi:electron transport complex protein RnfC
VNMLVRFLEARLYEDARTLYDLDCCIECGLCSYVCVTRIPIFQYIKVGKYELSLMETAEAANE